jgi:hypothetical protein
MVTSEGLSAKPGDRVVLTDIKIEHSKIVFDMNGGPDPSTAFCAMSRSAQGRDEPPWCSRDDHEQDRSRAHPDL